VYLRTLLIHGARSALRQSKPQRALGAALAGGATRTLLPGLGEQKTRALFGRCSHTGALFRPIIAPSGNQAA